MRILSIVSSILMLLSCGQTQPNSSLKGEVGNEILALLATPTRTCRVDEEKDFRWDSKLDDGSLLVTCFEAVGKSEKKREIVFSIYGKTSNLRVYDLNRKEVFDMTSKQPRSAIKARLAYLLQRYQFENDFALYGAKAGVQRSSDVIDGRPWIVVPMCIHKYDQSGKETYSASNTAIEGCVKTSQKYIEEVLRYRSRYDMSTDIPNKLIKTYFTYACIDRVDEACAMKR